MRSPTPSRREISAGTVLVRRMRGRLWVAVTRPQGRAPETWTLPKGVVEQGEPAAHAALRETAEETGVSGRVVAKLGDVRYVYTWDGQRVFKIVSFFLAHPVSGRIGELPEGMHVEIAEARWLPLDDAVAQLIYPGEREMAERARALVGELTHGRGDTLDSPLSRSRLPSRRAGDL